MIIHNTMMMMMMTMKVRSIKRCWDETHFIRRALLSHSKIDWTREQ